jgi:hypothetical protein
MGVGEHEHGKRAQYEAVSQRDIVTLSGYIPAAELLRWHGEGAGSSSGMLRLLESGRQDANGWERGAKAAEAGDCT